MTTEEIAKLNAECSRLSAQIAGARRALIGAQAALDAIVTEYRDAVNRLAEAVDKNRDQ